MASKTENNNVKVVPETESGRCACCIPCCLACKKCCHVKYNPLPEGATIGNKCRHAFLCPPHGFVARSLTSLLIVGLVWSVPWSILGDDVLPGGNLFALIIMLILCTFAGKLMDLIRLPPLLGMLLMGFLLQNVPKVSIAKDIDRNWSIALRLIALAVILIRAGMGLDYNKLKSMSGAVFRISVIPCAVEVIVAAGVAVGLFGFPWGFAIMLGFVHAAVSPAVVVPSMLNLQQRRLGTNKGIPTTLIAGGSIENVLAISGFSLVLGITLSGGSLVFNILRCPMEIIVGVAFGLLGGALLWFIPPITDSTLALTRFISLLGAGLLAMFGSRVAGLPGAGALGCLTIAFMAAHGWRTRAKPGDTGLADVSAMVQLSWGVIFQPWLFGLIGAEVKVEDLKGDIIGNATIIAAVALLCRSIATFLAMFGARLKHKEKFFVALAWLPKATVQAAIGSSTLDALDCGEGGSSSEEECRMATIILTIAVYVIILTAPIGAILISMTAPKLLHQSGPEDDAETGGKPAEAEEEEEESPAKEFLQDGQDPAPANKLDVAEETNL